MQRPAQVHRALVGIQRCPIFGCGKAVGEHTQEIAVPRAVVECRSLVTRRPVGAALVVPGIVEQPLDVRISSHRILLRIESAAA